jgi:hypothetical protein
MAGPHHQAEAAKASSQSVTLNPVGMASQSNRIAGRE